MDGWIDAVRAMAITPQMVTWGLVLKTKIDDTVPFYSWVLETFLCVISRQICSKKLYDSVKLELSNERY